MNLKRRTDDLRLLAIFMSLILIPSGLLGYFSWRALQNEKLLAEEKLLESYNRFARLVAKRIDDELENIEKRWLNALRKVNRSFKKQPDIRKIEAFVEKDSLIAGFYMLSAPGKVEYPPGVFLGSTPPLAEQWKQEHFVSEYEIFSNLLARGEALEYEKGKLQEAITVYKKILDQVTLPQLEAVALSNIGRALLKMGEWERAVAVYREILRDYPETRDINNMYIRFLAQYQIAVALENLNRDREAIEVLLELNRDLIQRSDAISLDQYEYFIEQIKWLSIRLLSSPALEEADRYRWAFATLAEQGKKRISQRYFLELLDRRLFKAIVEKKHYRKKFYYLSDEAGGQPYLIGYRYLPSASRRFVSGIIGFEINLDILKHKLFPAVLSDIDVSENVILGIVNARGELVIGTSQAHGTPIAMHPLGKPFSFWRVALYLKEGTLLPERGHFKYSIGYWIVSLLLLCIFAGAFIFVRRAMREAYLSRLKSDFVSSISHEFKTPLASIKMLAELLEMQLSRKNRKKSDQSSEKAKRYLQVIQGECDRLTRLINNVLDFSKIERGVKGYHFSIQDPGKLVESVMEIFRPHAESQGFRLSVEVAKNLPQISMDADAISQVLFNILSNAVKYSDTRKEIHVRCLHEQKFVIIEIKDKGIGIPKHEIPKIFDDFYRVDTRLNSIRQGGMGLGLTLVKHIIRDHGGKIEVESQVGEGSTFRVYLPCVTTNQHEEITEPQHTEQIIINHQKVENEP